MKHVPDKDRLARVEAKLRWAEADGSPVVGDVAETARFATRRRDSAPRRHKNPSRDERVRDLVRGFVNADGGASWVGRMKSDYQSLAEQLANVHQPLDSGHGTAKSVTQCSGMSPGG